MEKNYIPDNLKKTIFPLTTWTSASMLHHLLIIPCCMLLLIIWHKYRWRQVSNFWIFVHILINIWNAFMLLRMQSQLRYCGWIYNWYCCPSHCCLITVASYVHMCSVFTNGYPISILTHAGIIRFWSLVYKCSYSHL